MIELLAEVARRIAFNERAYGRACTGETEDVEFIVQPLLDEIQRLRVALGDGRRDEETT